MMEDLHVPTVTKLAEEVQRMALEECDIDVRVPPPPKEKRVQEKRTPLHPLNTGDDARTGSKPTLAPRVRLPNLDSFFTHTTPCLPSHKEPPCAPEIRGEEADSESFYHLQDLWESYEEWSAYGAEVPLVMESGEEVLQYYVPYLSAIQLFAKDHNAKQRSPRTSNGTSNDITGESSCSEGDCESSDGDSERLSCRSTDITCDSDSLESNSEDGDNLSARSVEHHTPKPVAQLLFEYFECAAPYTRSPLADKVAELSRTYPDLVTLRSNELDPSSWISVAWYPIYRIPTGRTLRDLSACFLSFHALNLCQQDKELASVRGCPQPQQHASRAGTIALENRRAASLQKLYKLGQTTAGELDVRKIETSTVKPFGFAAYKLRGEVWNATGNVQKVHQDMHNSARYWLRRRNIRHPDFEFFLNR